MPSSVGALTCSASSGMSSTNAPTACRLAAVPYGAARASRTSAGRPGRERAQATRTNVGVAVQIACRSAGVRASRMSDGAAASAGWWTAVLARTTARTRSRWASAQPSEITPPQSCPAVTTGPVTSSASTTAVRSPIRCARVRARSGRSEKPMPSWSTATTRHPSGASARNRRHR